MPFENGGVTAIDETVAILLLRAIRGTRRGEKVPPQPDLAAVVPWRTRRARSWARLRTSSTLPTRNWNRFFGSLFP
jgi:hypothetical protein